MREFGDTIVAPITGAGRAAVAVVRLSGPKSLLIAEALAPSLPRPAELRHSYHCEYVTGDDGLIVVFGDDRSYTGESSVELSVHGSAESVRALVVTAIGCGARMAEPGEFTLRAFLNGKIDLSQAEGVRATVDANSKLQLVAANRLRGGELGAKLAPVESAVAYALAAVEVSTDFGEETGPLDAATVLGRLTEAQNVLGRLLETQAASRIIQHGFRVAIVGRPNVGKSSLLNAILGHERAIVTAIPGTTRDTLAETVELDGIPVTFVDTAGLRETEDEVEQIGVARSESEIESADLVVQVYASDAGLHGDEPLKDALLVANKCDLCAPPDGGLPVSTKTGEGLAELLKEISIRWTDLGEPGFLVDRHFPLLLQAQQAVQRAMDTLSSPDLPADIAAVDLRQALRLIGELTGSQAGPDVLEKVFSEFCIGK